MRRIGFALLVFNASLVFGQTQGLAQDTTTARCVSVDRLKAHVATLAGEIGERNVLHPAALHAAADYIRQIWQAQGYAVSTVEYTLNGRTWANLEITRQGQGESPAIILIGAHYDSVAGSPGANDNASGVAALLELSRCLAAHRPLRTLRFVAFVNEEPPFFYTADMGSRVYVQAALARGDDIQAMLALETIGYYTGEPDSQRYPPLFSLFHPDRGNFIAFVANFASRALLRQAVAGFRAASDFPVEQTATFSWLAGVHWSDHYSFWREGIPALMVTDTALYRYPYYHSRLDTPEKLDYDGLGRVAAGLHGMSAALADAPMN